MSRSDVLTMVSDLCLAQSDATEVGVLYDEIVRELGFYDVLVGTETIAVAAGTATYPLAAENMRVLEVDALTGRLDRASGSALRAVYGAGWQQRSGTPVAFTSEDEDSHVLRLVPVPLRADTLTVIRAETRVDVPYWLELGIAFEILHREFMRESDHQDVEFAGVARGIANLLLALVGVEVGNAQITGGTQSGN